MGFYGSQGPTILPGDDRAGKMARAIGNLTDTIQQRRNDSDVADDNSAKVKAAGLVALVQKFNLTPEQYAEVRQKAVAFDPKVDQYLPPLPSFTPSEQNNYDAKVLKAKSSTFDTLPQGALQQGTYQDAFKAAMPQDTVKLTNQQDVTGNKDKWTPEVQQGAAIERGAEMNADQKAVTGETAKHNRVEEGQTGSVRAAQVRNINSEIPLHGAQTQEALAGVPLKQAQTKAVLSKADGGAADAGLSEYSKKAIAEIDPLLEQVSLVIDKYAPHQKENNIATDRDLMSYAKYRSGVALPDDDPMSVAAPLSMLNVAAASRVLKGGSRAYQALMLAKQHTPDPTGTRASIYQRAVQMYNYLKNARTSAIDEGGDVSATDARNSLPTPKSFGSQNSQTFKMTATGRNGHKIGSNDGNTWYDMATGQQVQ